MPILSMPASQVVIVNGRATIAAAPSKPSQPRSYQGNSTARDHRHHASSLCRAEQLSPRYDLITPGEPLAIDCEGLILDRPNGRKDRGVGRVSVVTKDGSLVYDTFVHYGRNVPHRPDPQRLKLGVTWDDIKPRNGAQLYDNVLKVLKTAFDKSGGIIIGHAISNDITMLSGLDWSQYQCHDTQNSAEYRTYASGERNKPSLRVLSQMVLGREIQVGSDGHSSVEDARATMELWVLHADDVTNNGGDLVHSARHNTKLKTRSAVSVAPVSTWRARTYAPGHMVALPDIPGLCRPGQVWDPKTSRYFSPSAW